MAMALSLASDLTCTVCMKIYRDPRTLVCLHSFCRDCLDNLHKKNLRAVAKQKSEEKTKKAQEAIKCPGCWKPTNLDKNGVDGLPKNSTLESITTKYKESRTPSIPCSLCEVNPRPAVKTCRDCAGTNYCLECLQFYHPRRGTFKGHALLDATSAYSSSGESADANSRIKIIALNQPSFQNTAVTQVSWTDEDGPANLYQVKCSLEREEMGRVYQEDVQTLATGCEILMAGLRLKTEYLATVTAMQNKSDVFLVRPQTPTPRKGELRFRTSEKLKYTSFAWDTSDCKATIALSKSRRSVTLRAFQTRKLLDACEELNASWDKVDGICSDTLFSSGKHYWEIHINYTVNKLMEKFDLICSVGINKHGRENSFTPLCRSHYCLCLALMKAHSKPEIVMKCWDGRDRSRSREISHCEIKRNADRSVLIGFYLDLDSKLFKVVDVEKNKLVHTFGQIDWSSVSVICELNNPDKVRCSLELFTEGFDEIPSALFD